MKSIVAAIAALAIAVVSAQEPAIVSITSPLEGTKYTAGKEATITWINPTVDTISKIVLAKGSATLLQPVADVAENVDAKAGSYKWTIPADTPPGTDYAFELGQSPSIAYTGHFIIEAGDGSSPNSTTPSASASAPAGSSSASSAPSKPAASGSASASGGEKSSSATGSSPAAEKSDESAGVKLTVGPVALALAGAAAVGLF